MCLRDFSCVEPVVFQELSTIDFSLTALKTGSGTRAGTWCKAVLAESAALKKSAALVAVPAYPAAALRSRKSFLTLALLRRGHSVN